MNAFSISALMCLLGTAAAVVQPEARCGCSSFSKTTGVSPRLDRGWSRGSSRSRGRRRFRVDATEDAAAFTPENLARYRAVVFLNSSGEVFDEKQKAAFQGFIHGGGGLAAVHQGITTLDGGRGTSHWSAA